MFENAKLRRIQFGTDGATADGIGIDEAQKRNLLQSEINLRRPLTDKEKTIVCESVVSQREFEKDVLITLLRNYITVADAANRIEYLAEIGDMIIEIKNANDHVNYTRQEFEMVKKTLCSEKFVPPSQWIFASELFKQLRNYDDLPAVDIQGSSE